ncbi:hypothetical protein VTP01DRAFT_5696 [Rhizomucor pusillus]|uniref:uncharacterized protein n=1 Tax=Rhizomucor pusillus TaxID=4840 RepID=UPI0037438111
MPATEILHSPGSDHTMVDTPVPPYLGSDPPRDQEVEMAEEESQRLDDQLREKHAIRVYEETHPDLQQKQTGGREIAEYEATWTVSTFRPNWGVDKMRDNNPLTYWQSDCTDPKAPHTIDLFFHQATFIKQVSIFIDYFQDESYTPKHISIRGGTNDRDLHEIMSLECDEGVGWQNADLTFAAGEPVRVFRLQIAILNTHLNGRDTHVRQIKVYSILPPYLHQQASGVPDDDHQSNGDKNDEEEAVPVVPKIFKGLR